MRLDPIAGGLVTYKTIRPFFCAAGMELNERGYIAPRFRPDRIPPPKGEHWSSDDTDLSNDRQVLDLHWLFCQKRPTNIENLALRELFEATEFNFDLASQIITTMGTAETKVDALGIDIPTQWELASIQTKTIRSKWGDIRKNARKIIC